jgi:hypothetical protein
MAVTPPLQEQTFAWLSGITFYITDETIANIGFDFLESGLLQIIGFQQPFGYTQFTGPGAVNFSNPTYAKWYDGPLPNPGTAGQYYIKYRILSETGTVGKGSSVTSGTWIAIDDDPPGTTVTRTLVSGGTITETQSNHYINVVAATGFAGATANSSVNMDIDFGQMVGSSITLLRTIPNVTLTAVSNASIPSNNTFTTQPPTTTTTTTVAPGTLTYNITSSAISVTEGATIRITVTTTYVPDGTVLNWSTGRLDLTPSYGTITINGNTAQFDITPDVDGMTEGTPTFTITLMEYMPGPPPYLALLKTSDPIIINDAPPGATTTTRAPTTTTAAPGVTTTTRAPTTTTAAPGATTTTRAPTTTTAAPGATTTTRAPTTTTAAPTITITTTTAAPGTGIKQLTIRNNGTGDVTVNSITFNDPLRVGHIANLTNLGGNAAETGNSVLSYFLRPSESRNFTVSYVDNGAGPGTHTGSIVVNGTQNTIASVNTTVVITY